MSKCVSKMQSAWIMFVTDRPRCWANLEKTKCILGMRVKILLRRKSQSVQSGIRQHGFSVQIHKAAIYKITSCKKHKSQWLQSCSQWGWIQSAKACEFKATQLGWTNSFSVAQKIFEKLHRKHFTFAICFPIVVNASFKLEGLKLICISFQKNKSLG